MGNNYKLYNNGEKSAKKAIKAHDQTYCKKIALYLYSCYSSWYISSSRPSQELRYGYMRTVNLESKEKSL